VSDTWGLSHDAGRVLPKIGGNCQISAQE